MARRPIRNARAIVTGASSGIGRAIARELARQGARLVITARRADRLEDLAGELRSVGADVHAVAGDITLPADRARLLEAAEREFGGLDILVNNAGSGAIGPFVDSTEQRLRQVMEVNFFAPVELLRGAIPLLRQGSLPVIANIGSVLGHRAVPNKSEYCASKFAIHGFSDALRTELSPEGIDVVLINPSTTQSEFFDHVEGDRSLEPGMKLGAMSAERVAGHTVRAIRRGRDEVVLSIGGKLLVWFERLSPSLMNRLMAAFHRR